MFKVENAAIPDGCCGQTLPGQLGVSHEPRQQPGQVHTQSCNSHHNISWVIHVTYVLRATFVTVFLHLLYGVCFVFLGVTLLNRNRICRVVFWRKTSRQLKTNRKSWQTKSNSSRRNYRPCRYPILLSMCLLSLSVLCTSGHNGLYLFPSENQHHQICSRYKEATTGGQHETNRELLSGTNSPFRASVSGSVF